MIYLSKLPLNYTNRRVQNEISNLYELHRTIMHAFPKDQGRQKSSVLFRLEQNNPSSSVNLRILVQSKVRPDWSFIESNEQFIANPGIEVKEFNPIIRRNEIYRFTLSVNPTRRNKESSKLIPIFNEDELNSWIVAKGAQYGFEPIFSSLIIKKNPPYVFYKRNGDQTQKINLVITNFSGLLKVVDQEKLLLGLTNGIGRGKSFGCGLLSLALP